MALCGGDFSLDTAAGKVDSTLPPIILLLALGDTNSVFFMFNFLHATLPGWAPLRLFYARFEKTDFIGLFEGFEERCPRG
jgi:hypothetical protein